MKLAALYTGHGGHTSLHLLGNGQYFAVDRLAVEPEFAHLRGLRDVGDLYVLGSTAVDELRTLAASTDHVDATSDVRLAPPVMRPSKIVCVGLNYLAHIEESGGTKPERIVLFAKYPSSLVGSGGQVRRPSFSTELDYEGELAVVIGRRTSAVSPEDAMGAIGGYTIINDISDRNLQITEPQWIRGKALDTFAPLGPVVLDAASAPAINDMRIVTRVNGEVRQDALCSLMITSVPELISYISAAITLEPGDIIATGTPSGVALGMAVPQYLQSGDRVSVVIDEIGELSNDIVA